MTQVHVSVDLRGLFGQVRNQGSRPTCMAFAASDAHAALRGAWVPLSCEYIFYAAQKRRGRPPTSGALLSATLEALRHIGQPAESSWPYLPAAAVDPATWAPPASVGTRFGRSGTKSAHTLDAIVKELDHGTPVIVLMMLSRSFYLPPATAIVHSTNDEKPEPERRHAVVAAGHGTCQGQRVLLIRNSWGMGWGDGGYAWLTEAFLTPRLYAAATLMEEVDVSANSLAA